MKSNYITVRMSRQRLEALHGLYEHTIANDVPEDNHEHLLNAHIVALYWRIDLMLNGGGHKQTKKFTMQVSECEALAFCLYWGDAHVPDPYANLVVLDVIKGIDKGRGNARIADQKRLSVWN